MPIGRKLVVEFIGTFFLVYTVCIATNPKTGAGSLAPLAIGEGDLEAGRTRGPLDELG